MELFRGEDPELLTIIGRFTVRFAVAETALDVCNGLIFRYCGGASIRRELPRELRNKIDFFQECQIKCSNLSGADEGFHAWGKQIVQEFTALREDRHFLIHGIGTEVLKGVHSIVKIRSEKTNLVPNERTMTSTFIVQLGDRSWGLATTALKYAIFLLRFVPTEQLRTLDVEFLETLESL